MPEQPAAEFAGQLAVIAQHLNQLAARDALLDDIRRLRQEIERSAEEIRAFRADLLKDKTPSPAEVVAEVRALRRLLMRWDAQGLPPTMSESADR